MAAGVDAQKRLLEPEELAPMATLLAGLRRGQRAITGQEMGVDGGYKV